MGSGQPLRRFCSARIPGTGRKGAEQPFCRGPAAAAQQGEPDGFSDSSHLSQRRIKAGGLIAGTNGRGGSDREKKSLPFRFEPLIAGNHQRAAAYEGKEYLLLCGGRLTAGTYQSGQLMAGVHGRDISCRRNRLPSAVPLFSVPRCGAGLRAARSFPDAQGGKASRCAAGGVRPLCRPFLSCLFPYKYCKINKGIISMGLSGPTGGFFVAFFPRGSIVAKWGDWYGKKL